MTLGERIKECRQQAGWSQETVAERLGVSRQAVTKWEAGQSMPSTANLFRLAQLFGTTVGFLFGEEPASPAPAERVIVKTVVVETKPAPRQAQPVPKWVNAVRWIAVAFFLTALFALFAWYGAYEKDNWGLMDVCACIAGVCVFCGTVCNLIRIVALFENRNRDSS